MTDLWSLCALTVLQILSMLVCVMQHYGKCQLLFNIQSDTFALHIDANKLLNTLVEYPCKRIEISTTKIFRCRLFPVLFVSGFVVLVSVLYRPTIKPAPFLYIYET